MKILLLPRICSPCPYVCNIESENMKLYDLLSRVTFDDLIPTLNTLVIKENQLPYFKMAFDELRMMAPTINDDDIDVEMAESYIYVDGCQDNWANVLGKNIIFDDDLQITV